MKRPKLILRSFKGISDVRIQTYKLKAANQVAIAVLIHGSRSHFASEFLNYSPNYGVCNNSSQKSGPDKDMISPDNSIKLDYLYGNDLSKNNPLKTIGKLQLETDIIDIYEDNTDGWATTNTFIYEGSFCQTLNINNITVYGMDLRSYGRSDSPSILLYGKRRGLVDNFDHASKDVAKFIDIIKNENSDNPPIYLFGMSMGGGVVARTVELYEDKQLVDGIILLSPMLDIVGDDQNFFIYKLMYLHSILSTILPTLSSASGDRSKESNPIERYRANDPLCSNLDIPYKTGYGMIKLTDDIFKDSVKIHPKISVLIFHSKSDNVCFYKGSESFYNSLIQVKKKKIVPLDKIDHLIITPPFCQQIAKYSSDWIKMGYSNCKLDYAYTP